MPLLDHFHPPLSVERRWESFHSSWATRIADALTERWLPPDYIAEEHAHFGPPVDLDAATSPTVSAPPAADGVMPAVFPDTFEVRVLSTEAGPRLVAAIELFSPGNKDRPAERRAFAIKCASYLSGGVSVIIVEVVTSRRANLHNDLLHLMEMDGGPSLPAEVSLHAVAYRPVRRGGRDEIDVWRAPLTLGRALPTLYLWLRGDLAVPVDFEAAYAEACLRKRLTAS